jgi:branched-chain amino acid transport system substrate-binding protein
MLRFVKCLVVCAAIALSLVSGGANAQEKLKIGFGLGLTGPLAANGKAALISMQIWAEELNARGGLLGRPVELVYYDDQGSPANVPGIYAKLLDVDKVDLVVSGYGTNMITPAMPLVMGKGMTMMSLIGLNANERFNYDRYFQIAPLGEDPADAFSRGYFDLAAGMNPKPQTVAILGADAEFGQLALEGARRQAKRLGFKIVFDRAYPPSTVDFSPIVRAMKATNPDFVFLASYPIDSVGIIRAVNEQGLTTGMFGGGMIGPQFAAIRSQLGPLLNGVVGYELYVPEPTVDFPFIKEFLSKYTTRASQEKIDPLGFYLPPYAYAAMQVIEQSVKAVGSLDQAKLAKHMHEATFDTAVGKIKFARNGEWEKDRILYVQYRGIEGSDIDQWRKAGRAPVLWPQSLKSGDLKYPYSSGKM